MVTMCLQEGLQLFLRAKEARFDGSHGLPNELCNLLVGHLLVVIEVQHVSQVAREVPHACCDVLYSLGLHRSYPVPSEPGCGRASPGVSRGSSRPLRWRKLLASFMAILMTHVVRLESPRKDGRKRRTLKNVDWKTSSASNRLPIRETRYV